MKRHEKALQDAATQVAVEHVQQPVDFGELGPDKVSTAIAKYVAGSESVTADSWCLLGSAEGEYPRIRVFKKLALLLNYLKRREGTETVVLIARGTPLALSKVLDGNRYLLMGESAIRIGDPSATVLPQSSLVGLMQQKDGWLGDELYTLDTEDDSDG